MVLPTCSKKVAASYKRSKKTHILLKELADFSMFFAIVRYSTYYRKKHAEISQFFKQKRANSQLFLRYGMKVPVVGFFGFHSIFTYSFQ